MMNDYLTNIMTELNFKNESNFMKYIIIPLYETLDLLLKEEDISNIYNNTINNMNYHLNKI